LHTFEPDILPSILSRNVKEKEWEIVTRSLQNKNKNKNKNSPLPIKIRWENKKEKIKNKPEIRRRRKKECIMMARKTRKRYRWKRWWCTLLLRERRQKDRDSDYMTCSYQPFVQCDFNCTLLLRTTLHNPATDIK